MTLDLGAVAELQATLSIEQLDLLMNGTPDQLREIMGIYVRRTADKAGVLLSCFSVQDMAFVLLMYFKSKQSLAHLIEELRRVAEEAEEEALGDEEDDDEEEVEGS
jgi:hypothetical protein